MLKLIKKKELTKLDSAHIECLPQSELIILCKNSVHTNKHLYDRLNQNSSTSNLPPSIDIFSGKKCSGESTSTGKQHNKADVRKQRANGVGRTQVLKTHRTEAIKPLVCCTCQQPFTASALKCYTGFYQIDLEKLAEDTFYHVLQTKFTLFDGHCPHCQTITRATIARLPTDMDDKTLSRQGIVGPTLAAEIITFHKENITSIRKIKATLQRLFGIKLSEGTIIQTINNGGIALEPVVETYRLEATKAPYAHMDETTWRNVGKKLWLWVIVTHNLCIFMMGRRTKAMAEAFLSTGFIGWLMTDGYQAYRDYKKRFRCWSHLERKGKACAESTDTEVSGFGTTLLALLNHLKAGIYHARESGNTASIMADYEDTLTEIKKLCESNKDSVHKKVKSLARELLNDWEAIFRILDYPHYPLTNNEAERALRQWVLLRKVTQGSQSESGCRATCAIASVIGTAKKRANEFVATLKTHLHEGLGVMNHITYRPLRLSG